MPLQLRQATEDDRVVIERLFQLYLHDTSRYSNQTVDEHGQFDAADLPSYLQGGDQKAFLFWLAGRLAGFAFVDDIHGTHQMTDFFVLWPYRRLGVGEEVARIIFEQHPGAWRVPYNEANDVARAFWRAVIYRFSRKDFVEVRDRDGYLALRFESAPRQDLSDYPETQPRFRTHAQQDAKSKLQADSP